ncbi:YrrS family protein [Sporosarcina sp. CAU 1771]
MSKPEMDFSRQTRRQGRKRKDKLLNFLIALVALLIVLTATIIFWGNDDEEQANDKKIEDRITEDEDVVDQDEESDSVEQDNKKETPEKDDTVEIEEPEVIEDNQEVVQEELEKPDDSASVEIERTDDDVVSETISNSSWQAIGTEQAGEHVSSYNAKSMDFLEKKKAIAYAVGQSEDSLNYWKVKNGGSPRKSIGIIDVKGTSEKYRVYIDWIDGQGWRPVKVDVLTTLDFDY